MADVGIAVYSSPGNYPSSPESHKNRSLGYSVHSMASSMSPTSPSQAQYGGGHQSPSPDKSPLGSLNLNFLKTLTEKRTTRDGQPAKRRGPKPDSKPALTRRQELNRQAQRTHRERKELYIKALEDEVLRLKEIYSNVSQDKERLAEENRQLKAMMVGQGGLSAGSALDDIVSNPSGGYASSASVSGHSSSLAGPASSATTAFTPPSGSNLGGSTPTQLTAATTGAQQMRNFSRQSQRQPGNGIDYDQAGIDFVLTLEKPCMDHLPWLLERDAEAGGGGPCGHALMASCPPEPFPDLTPDIPFGYANVRGAHQHAPKQPEYSGQRTWELSKADLATLLDLSKRLNLDGEITPVMAWGMVLGHPRIGELSLADFERLAEELRSKMRCYGFGAVMEEFEARDALENILSMKLDHKPEYTF